MFELLTAFRLGLFYFAKVDLGPVADCSERGNPCVFVYLQIGDRKAAMSLSTTSDFQEQTSWAANWGKAGLAVKRFSRHSARLDWD